MNDQSYRITFLSRSNLYCFLFLAFPTLLKNEILHQQLWGYKVEWRSVCRGTGEKVEYHCSRVSDCDTFLNLLVAKLRDRISVSNGARQKFY
jgi:hypothetical protein